MNFSEMQVALILYCILVNGLDKTKGEKFDHIKKEMLPLIKILKEIFCEFDKNEIQKERTFIFALNPNDSYNKDFYIINNKNYLLRKYPDINSMLLNQKDEKDEKDERKNKYYSIVLDYYLREFNKIICIFKNNSSHEGEKKTNFKF